MDIFSCESQMIAAGYWDENTHSSTQMIPSPTTFGLDMGPLGPNNSGPELGFPDTNIYLLF